MPDPVETQNAIAPSGAEATAPSAAAPMVKRDMAGQVIGQASPPPADAGCSHTSSRTHATGTPLCAPQPIRDPTNHGALFVAMVCALLIVGGVLTFMGRGPGKLIRPKPRRRGATQRARRWRRRVGVALVVVGVIGVARALA